MQIDGKEPNEHDIGYLDEYLNDEGMCRIARSGDGFKINHSEAHRCDT